MYNIIIKYDQFNNAVNETLKNSKYDALQSKSTNILETIRDKVLNFIIDLFSEMNINADYTSIKPLLNLILITIIILIIALSFFIVNKIIGKLQKSSTIKEIPSVIDINEIRSYSISDLITKGRGLAVDGKFRDSIRFHYLALLCIFNNENILSLDEVKTNGQILTELKTKKFLNIDLFSNMVEMVDVSWYGHKEIHEGSYRNFIDSFETLLMGVKNG